MLLAKWSEQYNVNIKEMDRQHEEILNMMNYLEEAIQNGKEERLIKMAVDDLNTCVESHLKEEEDFLERINYTDLLNHKSRHTQFLVQFHMMNYAYQSGYLDVVQIFVQYLKKWFVFHVFSEDRIYGAFVESHKSKIDVEALKVHREKRKRTFDGDKFIAGG